ncbi:unnamed protein product [Echinostoma caproni]|uniref:RING-type domain-containing protein n=1 Tax=Echinostoma caproni TaxID=27848 RepID=A0A182ZZG3_9TREM|nr:unnamed protein product [Echinostoma caproni]
MFVRSPIFSLAFGAFAKLYEDEACLANHKAFVWSKLSEFCITLHTSRKNVCNLLSRADVAGTNRLTAALSCTICKAPYFHPIVLFCGHSFCRKCVDARLSCQCCSASTTSGELSDCILLTKTIRHFFPNVASLYQRVDELCTLTARGHYTEALTAVDQLLEQYPNHARCLQIKVDVCLLNSDYETALSIIDKQIGQVSPVPKVYFFVVKCYANATQWFCHKGRALKGLGRRRLALEYFFKCFTLFPYSDCLRSEIMLILDEVITNADVAQWKNIVELCTTESAPVLDVLTVELFCLNVNGI